ncbi:MAG: universal stress protein [Desulfobacterales bacterium]
MSGLVIPIKELSPPELAAVRFALEYSKRSQARLFFLFVDDPESNQIDPLGKKPGEGSMDRESIRNVIESLIAREQALGELNLEVHNRRGDFIQEVRQFIRDSHADEIVMPVSEELEPVNRPIQQEIQVLAQMTHCRILTVKPKPIFDGLANPDQ